MSTIRTRLDELELELSKGQRRLETLDQERQQVRDTLLRISGAIQVLQELLAQEEGSSNGNGNHHSVSPVEAEG